MSMDITHLMDEKPNERDPFRFLMTLDGAVEASLGAPPAGATPVPGSVLSAEELEQLTADIVAAPADLWAGLHRHAEQREAVRQYALSCGF